MNKLGTNDLYFLAIEGFGKSPGLEPGKYPHSHRMGREIAVSYCSEVAREVGSPISSSTLSLPIP